MRLINLLQTFLDHVRVNLRRRNVRVTKHHLHRTKVRASIEQMRGKAMTEHVRGQRLAEAGFPPIFPQALPKCDAIYLMPSLIQEKVGRPALPQQLWASLSRMYFCTNFERLAAHGHEALLVPLADAAKTPRIHLQV